MSENDEGQYTAYNESLVANGRPVVLFFHAAWCHYCQANNDLLLKLYSENSYKVSVLKIDYDTAADLKAKYGVVQQDTFVALDAEGNVQTTVSMPAEGKLEALLTGDY